MRRLIKRLGSNMIELTNISKKYGNHTIFKKFNMSIKKNEKIAITGASGSGKSTLLNIISGITSIDGGEVIVDKWNNPQIGRTNPSFYSQTISFLLQDYGLVPELSIIDNVRMGNPKLTANIISQTMSEVGLEHKITTKIHTLSGGEQQRVALVRVLLKPSLVILCDEPTGNLDKDTGMEVIEIILSLDKTVVIVTHDEEIADKCDRIIYL